jgi:hypothetical protein
VTRLLQAQKRFVQQCMRVEQRVAAATREA